LVAENGSFVLLRVPAGRYTVVAPGLTSELSFRAPNLGVKEIPLPENPGAGKRAASSPLAVAPWLVLTTAEPNGSVTGHVSRELIVDSDTDDLELRLEEGASVQCSVVFDDLVGQRPAGSVLLSGADGGPILGLHSRFMTSSSADPVVFPSLLPGTYSILTTFPGMTIKAISLNGSPVESTFEVISGQRSSLSVTLTGKGIGVTGRVVDSAGQPSTAGAVLFFPTAQSVWTDAGVAPSFLKSTQSSSDGSYNIMSLRAGEYFVVAIDRQELFNSFSVEALTRLSRRAVRVSLDWGDHKTIDVILQR